MYFSERNVSVAQISLLLLVWSASAFALEVPSGALADLVDRRRLLVASGALYGAGFATWMLWDEFAGFLLGFVLWSMSSALASGTFEALLFDALAETGDQHDYGRIRSRSETLAGVASMVATAAAAPLYAIGGYALVGWASVAVAVLHCGAASMLPRPAARTHVAPAVTKSAYLRVLRDGVREAARSVPVRRTLVAYGTVVMLVGFDEYYALLFAADGASPVVIAWLMGAVIGCYALGTAGADRVAGWRPLPFAALVAVAGLLLVGGSLWSGWASYAMIGLGYAAATASYLAGEIRLQHVIVGDSRATTTSVGGLVAETGFMPVLVAMGFATQRWPVGRSIAVLGAAITVIAVAAAVRSEPFHPLDDNPVEDV